MRRPRTSWEAGAHELLETQAQIYAEVLRTIDPDEAPDEVTHATAGGDERKLRGIPAIGRGVAGAIPGTSPHGSLT